MIESPAVEPPAEASAALATASPSAELPYTDYILVIGSAHLDTMADYRFDQESNLDKLGTVSYAPGGTAFNIAVNLAAQGKAVSLYTHLRSGSFVTEAIFNRCRQTGVDTRFVTLDKGLPEGGFVAHRREGEVVAAVSFMSVAAAKLDEGRLRDALRGCACAVIECNLLEPQIKLVSFLAQEAGVPLVVAGVSEAKVGRALSVFRSPEEPRPITLFSCNRVEAERLMDGPFGKWTGEELLARVRAKHALVTRSWLGCCLYSQDRADRQFPAPQVGSILSTQGAGDAHLAAFCAAYAEDKEFDRPDMIARIIRYVGKALASRASTLDRQAAVEAIRAA